MPFSACKTIFIERGECVLRFRIAFVGGRLEQLRGVREVLRKLTAVEVKQSEVVGGERMPELGGLVEQLGAFLWIARAGAALEVEHGERKHGLRVAMAGGESVPSLSLRVAPPISKPWSITPS